MICFHVCVDDSTTGPCHVVHLRCRVKIYVMRIFIMLCGHFIITYYYGSQWWILFANLPKEEKIIILVIFGIKITSCEQVSCLGCAYLQCSFTVPLWYQ